MTVTYCRKSPSKNWRDFFFFRKNYSDLLCSRKAETSEESLWKFVNHFLSQSSHLWRQSSVDVASVITHKIQCSKGGWRALEKQMKSSPSVLRTTWGEPLATWKRFILSIRIWWGNRFGFHLILYCCFSLLPWRLVTCHLYKCSPLLLILYWKAENKTSLITRLRNSVSLRGKAKKEFFIGYSNF